MDTLKEADDNPHRPDSLQSRYLTLMASPVKWILIKQISLNVVTSSRQSTELTAAVFIVFVSQSARQPKMEWNVSPVRHRIWWVVTAASTTTSCATVSSIVPEAKMKTDNRACSIKR